MLLGLGAQDKPGEEASSPITNYTQAGEWHANTGGDQLAWIQKSGINGGSPYQVFCQYSNGHLWGAIGRWVGSDSTASNAGGGKYRWCSCKNPADTSSGNQNDWGQATHTFNQNFNKFTGGESARTRLWFEGQGNKTRVLFSGIFVTIPSTKVIRSDFSLFSLHLLMSLGLHSNAVTVAFGNKEVNFKDSWQSYAPISITFLQSNTLDLYF